MGSGLSSSRHKAANHNQTKVTESIVGQSLASVLSSSDGHTTDNVGRLQYPQNAHAAFDVERYVVDENGLRKLVGGDVTGPKGVWWNDASLAAEVNSAEGRLSSPTQESTAGREQAETTEAQAVAASEGSGLNAAGDERVLHLPERGMEETWDRFTTGGFLAPDLELNQSARPCTPPNLARTIQENVSAAGYAAYRLRRVAELTAPQLAESIGLLGFGDTRYAARAKPHAGVAVVEDKEFIPGWVAVEASPVDDVNQPVYRIREEEDWEEEEEEEEKKKDEGEVARFLEHTGSSGLVSFTSRDQEGAQTQDAWCEGHGLNRWRQEFDQARGLIRTKLAIKDSRGTIVLRKPPPPPEDELFFMVENRE